jgi:VanZ family protein
VSRVDGGPARGPLPESPARQRTAHGWLVVLAVLLTVHLVALYWPRVAVDGPVTWSDKAVHVAVFALPAAAGLLAGLRPAYVLVPLALHAPLSEILQHAVLPHRSGDPADVVADLVGVVLGATVGMVGRARARW